MAGLAVQFTDQLRPGKNRDLLLCLRCVVDERFELLENLSSESFGGPNRHHGGWFAWLACAASGHGGLRVIEAVHLHRKRVSIRLNA
jgi:hypothetical protein